jgi:hypothetical protein
VQQGYEMKRFLLSSFMGWLLTIVMFSVVLPGGISIFSYISEVKAAPGIEVPGRFYLVSEPELNGTQFRYFSYSDLARQRSAAQLSFLMSKPKGFIDTGNFRVLYKVLEDNKTSQLIEVRAGEDENIIGRYRATQNDITPVSWRSFGIGQMFASFPVTLFIVYLFRRFWKKLQNRYMI